MTILSTRAPRFRVALTPGAADLSVFEQKNAVGQLSGFLLAVCDVQCGDAGLVADGSQQRASFSRVSSSRALSGSSRQRILDDWPGRDPRRPVAPPRR